MLNKIQFTSNIAFDKSKTQSQQKKHGSFVCKNSSATNLNYSPSNIYNRISFGIDDTGKKPVKGVKNIKIVNKDFAQDINANRKYILGKDSYPTSSLQDRMDDEAKGFEGHSAPIEFYPEDLEKLEKIEDIDQKIEFLVNLRKNKKFKSTQEDNKNL